MSLRLIEALRGLCATAAASCFSMVEYRTRTRHVAGSTHTRSIASNLEQAANLLHVCSGQLSLLPSAGREMSSSYSYGAKA